MADCLFRIGVLVTVIGAILLSPLSDFLPVDFWGWLRGLFQSDRSSEYLRVVPTQNSNLLEYVLIGVGLVLVATSYYLREHK